MKIVNNKAISFFKFIIFAAIFLILFIFISYVIRPNDIGNKPYIESFYSEKHNTIDVVCIGSSTTLRSWSPMQAWDQYGIASYNFSGSSLSPELIKNMIVEAQKYQSPKLYIIDLHPFLQKEKNLQYFKTSNLSNYTDWFKFSLNRQEMLVNPYENGTFENNDNFNIITNTFNIIKFHSEWKNIKEDSFRYAFSKNSLVGKGEVSIDDQLDDHQQFKKVALHETSNENGIAKLDPQNEKTLDALLKYCRDEQLPLLFVMQCVELNNDDKKIVNAIEQHVGEYNCEFMDLNEHYKDMGMINTDFIDPIHLNCYGVSKYTRYLGKVIKSKYDIPNRKEESAYDSWNADYIEYVKVNKQFFNNTRKAIEETY